jgi:hypothetical protein
LKCVPPGYKLKERKRPRCIDRESGTSATIEGIGIGMTIGRKKRRTALIGALIWCLCTAGGRAAVYDVSDEAMERFLETSFQYDYTSVSDDATLRKLIDALDYQFTMIDFRQRQEFFGGPGIAPDGPGYRQQLEERYLAILRDGFVSKKLTEWQTKTTDPVNRAFIDLFLSRRDALISDPTATRTANDLARRIAERLYSFRFRVGDNVYAASDAAEVVYAGEDDELARTLFRMQNDSAAMLAGDAVKLYEIYRQLGEQRGFPSSLAYNLSRLSFRRPEWLKIADGFKQTTDAEYRACRDALQEAAGRTDLRLFEIDQMLYDRASLPDSFFTPEKNDSAVTRLLYDLGLGGTMDRLTIIPVDSTSLPALAVRLLPPDEVLLVRSNRGGFAAYQRLATEIGRSLPWVYADTSLPALLRDYPFGSEEMLAGLMEQLALRPTFLADHFGIPQAELERFQKYRRWLNVLRIRQTLQFFYFDYYLSEGMAADPIKVSFALEDSLFGTSDSTFQWIEVLLEGDLEDYPTKLAELYTRVRTEEMLYRLAGDGYAADTLSGQFLINRFCLPGRTQTIETYITANTTDRLSVSDIKRQLGLR